jgi:hypothetical protein
MRNTFDKIRKVSLSKSNQSGEKEEGKLRLINWIIKFEKANRTNLAMRALAFLKWKKLISYKNHAS